MKDKTQILKGLNLKNEQVIIDLGAGDGVVILEAAYESLKRKLNTRFVALEINPVLISIMYIKWLFHPNRKNIKIVWGDMFKLDYKKLILTDFNRFQPILTFYLYISPWLIEKVINRIQNQLPKAKFVSYYYPILSLQKKEKILKGLHNTYLYN